MAPFLSERVVRNAKTHGALFMSQAPFGVYVVLARGSVGHIAPNVLVFLRFAGGLFWLFLFHLLVHEKNMFKAFFALPAKMRWDIALIGVIAGVGPTLFIYGVKHCSAAVAAAVDASMPAIAVGLSLVMRTERLTWTNGICVALSLLGNYMVLQLWTFHKQGQSAADQAAENSIAFGAFLCFVSALLSVVNSMLQRPLLRVVPPEELVCYMLSVGIWVVAALNAFDVGAFKVLAQPQPPLTWAMVTYALVLQGWMHSFFMALAVARSSPVMVAMYSALVPAITSTLAYLVLHETLSTWQFIGSALVVLSVAASAVQFDSGKPDKSDDKSLE